MNRKSQVTMFIIIGVVIMAAFLFVLVISNGFTIKVGNLDEVENFADKCFETAGVCLLERLGESGGNLEYNEEILSLEQINKNSEEYFIKTAELCENGFKDIQAATVISEVIKPKFLFNPSDTIIKTKQKITVKRGETSKSFDDFLTKLDIRFAKSHELAKKINKHDLTLIDNSYINTNLLETDEYNANAYQRGNIVIILSDIESNVKGEPYKFAFIKS